MSFERFVSALEAELPAALGPAERLGLSPTETWNVLVVAQLREALSGIVRARGRDVAALASGRLFATVPGFEPDQRAAVRQQLLLELGVGRAAPAVAEPLSVDAFGQLYETLLAARPAQGRHGLRKSTGSYYTPEALTAVVAERAFDALSALLGHAGLSARPLRIVDPALGAGAFLLRAAREIVSRSGRAVSQVVSGELFGSDVSPLALAVAEASLWLLADDPELTLEAVGTHLREGDALCSPAAARQLGRRGVDFSELAGSTEGFDLVIGNPPWVAFAGRATKPLSPELRAHYRRHFQAFSGYPTLHGMFVELSARLAPRGVVALLIPSPVADLDGYRHVRHSLTATHRVHEPLLELGQDAFASVTQPCFALLASPGAQPNADPARPFVLSERRRAAGVASELRTPAALERLAERSRLPAELFGEMGLQTNSAVTRELLFRGQLPPPDFSYALLEGRNISEFELSAPRLFLKPDRETLERTRCRLRDAADYRRVKLVVRQTAAIPIAAAHDGTPFRNSLLAVFESAEFPAALTLGLLNSALMRALHLAGRRDARQGAFPQLKIAHLRGLPAPPESASRARVAELSERASRGGLTRELRLELDRSVFELFGVGATDAHEITEFVKQLSPRAGLKAPLD